MNDATLYTETMKRLQIFCVHFSLLIAGVLMLTACTKAKAGMSADVLAEAPQATLVWKRVNDMPVGVFEAAISTQGRNAVVTGGLDQGGQSSVLVQVLNLDTLTWTTPLKLKEGLSYHTQVTLQDGSIFIAGGKTGTLLEKLVRVAHTWIISADLQTISPGPDLVDAAHKLTSHLLPDGKVIVIANKNATLYDPATNSWIKRIALRSNRVEHASVLLPDGRVVVGGGISNKTIEVVDFSRGASTQLASEFSGPRDDLAGSLLPDGRVLFMGGQHSQTGKTVDENLVLDVSDERKSSMIPMRPMGIPNGVSDQAIATSGRWIFSLGGESDHGDRDVELTEARIIDGKTLELWSLPAMTVPHDDAVAIADGKSVLIIGGYSVNLIKIGPLVTRMPTAVSVVERLVLPVEKFE